MKYGDTIINDASVNAYVGRPDLLDYTSSKGAIVSFTRGLSNQFVGKGIRVNMVCRFAMIIHNCRLILP
jgi:NAD(P)-dependent dehydrogenase (short-subunit alcohol dehydrogenase family)